MKDQEVTEIVELPAIMCGGNISIADPSLRTLDSVDLKSLAKMMDGKLIWVKRRVVYEELEVPTCTRKGCWRPASTALGCSDHPEG